MISKSYAVWLICSILVFLVALSCGGVVCITGVGKCKRMNMHFSIKTAGYNSFVGLGAIWYKPLNKYNKIVINAAFLTKVSKESTKML